MQEKGLKLKGVFIQIYFTSAFHPCISLYLSVERGILE